MTGVLSDKEILEALEDGRIIIDPFDPRNLSTSSYDIRLGEFYYQEQPPSETDILFNPYDKSHVDRVWGNQMQAQPMWAAYINLFSTPLNNSDPLVGIKREDLVIIIPPHQTILAHSQEFIGGVQYATSMMKARSSFGRCFIEVCKCAGWGDVGYFSRWTMEITNNSHYYHIPLVVGRRIAQIAFLQTGAILDSQQSYSSSGKYQLSDRLEEVKANWKPEQMLPQLYKDRDIQL